MATTMAMKVVESIMGKLERMLTEEAALLAGVKDDVRYIVAELRSITAFLTAMSTRRNLDDQRQNWVQEVMEVAYDAEDSIDEFACRLRSTPYDERGVKSLLKYFLRCIKSLKARHDIASELKKLKVQVEEIRKQHDRYSHPNESFTSSGTTSSLDMADNYFDPRIISHFVEEAQLVDINETPDRQFKFKDSPLSAEQSWKLFCRRVFEAPDYSCPPELENVGKEFLQKCDGLPLAIVTIGGLLASRPDKKLEEWNDLRDHLRLELQTNDMLSKIDQILVLSYNDLPYHLKPCFLFLGIYPKDYEIRRKPLMRRWIAEDIVTGVDSFPAEKVADRCFNQLVSRSLVLPSQFDDSGTVKSCRVHDMMLDVILSISRKENFAVLLNEQPTIPPQHQKIRRLSWHGGSSRLVRHTDLSHLRSFNAFSKVVPLKDYRKQRLLRAIDLEGCSKSLDLHPKSFSKLFLLKYLSLRGSPISVLPDSIGDLQNLEFLDIRRTLIDQLPDTIVNLQKLEYLLVGWCFRKHNFRKGVEPVKVPKGMGKLKRLGAFGMACVDNVRLLQVIGELAVLKKLAVDFGVRDLSHRMLEEISVLLSKLNVSLRSLKIVHLETGSLKKALDEVASPPLLLCKLLIQCRIGELPPWFASPKNVVKITLFGTLLQLEDLQVLRNLPALVHLILGSKSFVNKDENLVFDQGGFAQLKFLEIRSHNVSFNVGAVPSLEILKIVSAFVSVNGIEHLHGLREVHIHTWDKHIKEMVKNIAANHPNRPKCFAPRGAIVQGI